MPQNILITHTLAANALRWKEVLTLKRPGDDIRIWPDAPANWADYAIGWSPSAELFAAQPRLKAFFSAAAGLDHLLSNPGLPKELPLIRLEDAGMGLQMAEYCLLEVARVYHRREEYLAQQREAVWKVLPSMRRSEFVVGIFGAGVLGKAISKGLEQFGYRVHMYSRSSEQLLEDFLAKSQVLILCAPLTELTRDYFNYEKLSQLPKGAYVVNVARGPLIVDEDLVALLNTGHLSGATLDVFRQEPLPKDHPFWANNKIRITPHVSAITLIGPSAEQVHQKLNLLEQGLPVTGLVNRQRGY